MDTFLIILAIILLCLLLWFGSVYFGMDKRRLRASAYLARMRPDIEEWLRLVADYYAGCPEGARLAALAGSFKSARKDAARIEAYSQAAALIAALRRDTPPEAAPSRLQALSRSLDYMLGQYDECALEYNQSREKGAHLIIARAFGLRPAERLPLTGFFPA